MVRRMAARINAEPEPRASRLWTATYLLMGLRFSGAVAFRLLEGVQNMRESTTYQAILREGRIEGRNEGLIEGSIRQLSACCSSKERFDSELPTKGSATPSR